jgi:uncharacterized YccA/Bax inhibitor family protein
MQSSNPVFRKADGFNGRSASGMSYPSQGGRPSTQTYARTAGQSYDPYAGGGTPTQVTGGPMTIDSVVQKTAFTLGLTILVAVATWFLTPPLDSDKAAVALYPLLLVGGLGGFALSMVNSFKRVVSPGLVLAYAALEGLLVGAFSKLLEGMFGGGLVLGAVAGTFAAVVGTLAAYKFFNIKVGDKFRTWVIAAMFGFVAVSLLDVVLAMFNSDLGVNGFGTTGLIFSLLGLGLGVLMLILDFDFVERGIEAGLPERESWRAAFGLTVTIIWIYIELLRILAILRGN